MRMGRTRNRQEPGASDFLFHPVVAVLLLTLLAGAIYANSLGNGFVFDDEGLVVQNTQIREIWQLPRILGLVGRAAYRPVRTASYTIDYYFFGLNPAGYHAVNILIHIVNGSLVFFTLRALLNRPLPALLAAMLFIVHPIQTDSVTYISGRRDLIFTLFYLIGFYAFIRYRAAGQYRYLILAGVSYLLSLLSKEMGITLPLLCFCYDVVRSLPDPGSRAGLSRWQAIQEGFRAVIRRYTWLYLPIAAAVVFFAGYFIFAVNPSLQRKMWGGGLWPTLLTSSRIFAHYLKLLAFPITLNADYSYDAFPISLSLAEPRVVFALFVLVAAWWGIYRLQSEERWAAFGGLWFFVTLLPVSQIIPHHELLAEHYLYLPSAGAFLAVALLVERLMERTSQPAAVSTAFALLVLLLATRTVIRNRDWKDSLTLWIKTVQTAPKSARAHTNLGEIYLRQGQTAKAEREFREALRIQPDDAVNRDNHGLALLKLGRVDEAEREFREALRFSPRPKTQINLGLVYLRRSQLDDAEREFRSILQSGGLEPEMRVTALNNLGIVSALKGKQEEAEQAFTEVIRLDQNNADARGNLGRLYLEKRKYREGAVQLEEAVRLKRSDANLHRLLGEAYYQQGKKELAAVELGWALSLNANFPEARALLNKIIREKEREQGRRG